MRWLDRIIDLTDMNLTKPQEIVKDRGAWLWSLNESDTTEQLNSNNIKPLKILFFWAPKSLWMVTATMKLEDAHSLEGKL